MTSVAVSNAQAGERAASANQKTDETLFAGNMDVAGLDAGKTNDGRDRYVTGDAAERITGSGAGEKIEAKKGDDIVNGGAGDDELRGNAGDDLLIGGKGNDILRGGNGTDTVQLTGHPADFDIALTDEGFTKVTNKHTGETDILRQIEKVTFTAEAGAGGAGKSLGTFDLSELSSGTLVAGSEAEAMTVPAAIQHMPSAQSGTPAAQGPIKSNVPDFPYVHRPELTGPAAQPIPVLPAAEPIPVLPAAEPIPVLPAAQPAPRPAAPPPHSQAPASTGVPVGGNENKINGSLFSESLNGTSRNDHIRGLMGNDRIAGGAGNDVLVGGDGHDALIGAAGIDRAIQFGSSADYSVAQRGAWVELINRTTGERDLLNGVEFVTFSDGTYSVEHLLAR